MKDLELLTIEDVSKILSVKLSWVRKAIFRKELSYRKIGALVRFTYDDIQTYINTCKKYHL